ncbi:hypothetical protein [Candidatus Hodarchaeum mangrovi]
MNPDESVEFRELSGLDELDTQLKLYQMGIESFSPYASKGKVDMIIRSEDGEEVRYADIKVCTGKKSNNDLVWELEISFFLNNQSFIILTARLPTVQEKIEKHYIILDSKDFLKLSQIHKLETQNDKWILKVPFKDLLSLTHEKKSTSTKIVNSLAEHFNNWNILIDWSIKKEKEVD